MSLTRREELAARAMQGLLTQFLSVECESGARDFEPIYDAGKAGKLAVVAVRIADELITQLDKPIRPLDDPKPILHHCLACGKTVEMMPDDEFPRSDEYCSHQWEPAD